MKILFAVLCAVIGLVSCDHCELSDNKCIKAEFLKAKIQPDIIDNSPEELIEVEYDNVKVDLGNEFKPTQTKDIPKISYNHTGGLLYTLVLTDPDVPVKGYNREWQHWLVGNIPEDKVHKGEVLSEYVGPAPPRGSGKHRYVFLLYRQKSAITFTDRRLSNRDKARNRFSIKKFATKYELEGPIAGNYMLAEYDDYVPTIHKQLGF